MFSKASPAQQQGQAPAARRGNGGPSLLAPDLHIVGNLHSQGDIQIDGTVDGNIHSETVTVGETAVVNGAIFGDRVRIAGSVNGEVTARTVELTNSARMTGDVNHGSLSVDAGAYIQGSCRHADDEALAVVDQNRVPASAAAAMPTAADSVDTDGGDGK